MGDIVTSFSALRAATAPDDRRGAPPHNLEIEQGLLGSILVSNDVFYRVNEIVAADDFYDPLHARLFAALASTIEAGRLADSRTLRGVFEKDEALAALGGATYLADLAASVITTINAVDFAQHLHELATRRRLIAFCGEVMQIARDQDAPPSSGEDLIGKAETMLFEMAERKSRESAVDMAAAFDETLAQIDAAVKSADGLTGFPSGIKRLDQILNGFRGGHLYVIAGRPAMGKTAIGLTIAANAAMAGVKTLFHSMEMTRTDIMARLLARRTGIPANKQGGSLSVEDFGRLFAERKEITSWPLFIDDDGRLKIGQIRGRAMRLKRRRGIDMIVIDYLGLVAPSDPKLNRNYQIEEITTGLKALAKELDIPIILLAQLNRELEKRDDKLPMLSDLRDSGSIEQDADVVMFIYRHEYYVTRDAPQQRDRESDDKYAERVDRWNRDVDKSRHKGELIVAKHRQGETGNVPLRFMGWKCLFTDDDSAAIQNSNP